MSNGDRTSLGDRMKGYEYVTRTSLVRRTPAIIRVDGKAFHTLTASMARPFDADFTACMAAAAVRLCEEIQGAQIAFVQSDEISVLLVDYQSLDTQPWLGVRVDRYAGLRRGVP
jgi:tRNA(His) guanylyltransferase